MKLFKGKKKKGFTLVELMVVVGIIALLLLLVVPRLAGNSEKAKTRTFESNYRTLASDITVALAAADGDAEFDKVVTKATGMAGSPEGSTYVITKNASNLSASTFQAKLGGYTLDYDLLEGTTKATGTAPGATYKP